MKKIWLGALHYGNLISYDNAFLFIEKLLQNKFEINLDISYLYSGGEALIIVGKLCKTFPEIKVSIKYGLQKMLDKDGRWGVDISNQSKILNCKKVIPFASFIYFSNKLNFYMNDSVNSPETVYDYLTKSLLNPIIMQPGEKQFVNQLRQNKSSLEFWKDKFEFNSQNKGIDIYKKSYKLEEIQNEFIKYQKKIFSKNSKALIYFLHKFNFLGAFQKLNIFFVDNKSNYEYSIFSGIKKTDNKEHDISMHSESLSFIFKNEFGFDTLTVNGCFECAPQNFSKVSKTLAIGSLNAMGLKLNLGIIFKLDIILLFLKKLIVFLRKLK